MRREFAELLYDEMKINDKIYVITADLGYGMLDRIRDDFSNRFYNCGSAEQLMIGIGIGLAEEGKIPVLYTITPFLLYRPFELLRTYVNHEKIPVKLVGAGRDKDYLHDGFTHWAVDDINLISKFHNIRHWIPETVKELQNIFSFIINNPKPYYINLKR